MTLEERSEFTLLGPEQFNKGDIKILLNVMWKLEVDPFKYQNQSRGGHFNSHPKSCTLEINIKEPIMIQNNIRQCLP